MLLACAIVVLESEGLNRAADGSAECDSLFMKGSRWSSPLMCMFAHHIDPSGFDDH